MKRSGGTFFPVMILRIIKSGRLGGFLRYASITPNIGDGVSLVNSARAATGGINRKSLLTKAALALLLATGITGFSGQAMAGPLQCVPYARDHSGIEIHGNAWTWWEKAKGLYERGAAPRIGAVLAMARSAAMPLGHVAVVRKIVDARHILLDHANWSSPGRIEHSALAEDVSDAGDWSEVRVWYGPARGLGSRVNPVSGFIYPGSGMEIAAAPDDDAKNAG